MILPGSEPPHILEIFRGRRCVGLLSSRFWLPQKQGLWEMLSDLPGTCSGSSLETPDLIRQTFGGIWAARWFSENGEDISSVCFCIAASTKLLFLEIFQMVLTSLLLASRVLIDWFEEVFIRVRAAPFSFSFQGRREACLLSSDFRLRQNEMAAWGVHTLSERNKVYGGLLVILLMQAPSCY